jgi:hypothetical protein
VKSRFYSINPRAIPFNEIIIITIADVLYIIDRELSGEFEKGIAGILVDTVLYTTFAEPLICAIATTESSQARFIRDKASVRGAPV